MKTALCLVALAGLPACGGASAFQCSQDSQCGDGQCEPASGFCIFEDEACAAGWKYGAHAGQGLAGLCVDSSGGSGDGAATDVADDGPGPGSTSAPTDDDVGDADVTTEPAGSTSLDTGGGPSCAGGTCLDAPPAGWLGPAAVLTGVGSIPTCPAELPATLTLGHTMLAADPAICGCGCDPVPGSCGEITITVDQVGATCDMGAAVVLDEGDCVDLLSEGVSATVAHAADPGAGMCDTNTSMQLTPPMWLDHLRVCVSSDPGACDGGGVCLPAVADADACIMRAGDVPCPAGAYSARTVVYGDYLDGRDCSDCECDVQGAICRIELREDDDCDDSPDIAWPTTTAHCEMFDVPIDETYTAQHDTVDNCGGVGGDPIGEATPIAPSTLCCVP